MTLTPTPIFERLLRRGLERNMIMAVIQAATGVLALFVSYRILIWWHGASMLGLWSLIGAFTLSIRMLDPSGGATVGRFIAIANSEKAPSITPVQYADTALLLMLTFYLGLCLLAWYPLALLVVSQLPDPTSVQVGLGLLPHMLILVVAMTLATSCADTLDGLNRADLRSIIMIAGYLIFLMCVIYLVPRFGLKGMANAQLIQYAFVTVAARVMARRETAGLALLPLTFNRPAAKAMISYGIKLQFGAMANFAADPLTRLLLNHFGGLPLVAAYELASKLVVQIRSLIVSGAMPLIPILAVGGSLDTPDVQRLLRRANRTSALLGIVMASISLAAAPVLSLTMIGRIDATVVTFAGLLAVGYAANILSLPLYLHSQALGNLKGNILGQFAIGATTLMLGFPAAIIFGPMAIVAAFATGLAVASGIFVASSLHSNRISWRVFW